MWGQPLVKKKFCAYHPDTVAPHQRHDMTTLDSVRKRMAHLKLNPTSLSRDGQKDGKGNPPTLYSRQRIWRVLEGREESQPMLEQLWLAMDKIETP